MGTATRRSQGLSSVIEPLNAANIERALGLAILACAGWVDAAGFLMFSGIFVSFMSGDTTQLGVRLGQGEWDWAGVSKFMLPPVIFVAGAAIGRVISNAWPGLARPLLLCIVAALLTATAIGGMADVGSFPLLAALIAMGMLNQVIREENGVPVGTMVTGALVRLGEVLGDRVTGAPGKVWDNAGQWLVFVIAAGLGAAAYDLSGASVFLVPAAASLFLAVQTAKASPTSGSGRTLNSPKGTG